jgi:hypothetical protein
MTRKDYRSGAIGAVVHFEFAVRPNRASRLHRGPGRRRSVGRAKTSAAWASGTVSGHVARGSETDRDEQDVEQNDGYGQPQDDGHVFLL